MTIDLEPEERTILVDLLETALSELSMEIADTDRLDFRRELKRRRAVITKALAAMRTAA